MTRRFCGNSFQKLLAIVFLASTLNPQHSMAQTLEGSPASEVLQWTETKQVEFVTSVMDGVFPEKDGDQFGILLINRSALVIPLLERRVEEELSKSTPSEQFIEIATSMIAFAGDSQALLAIGKLIQIDETRFGRLVDRTMDNALTFRNPFTVAYAGVEIGNHTVSVKIGAWAETVLRSRRMQRLFAEAVVERYGRVPSENELAVDSLTTLLKPNPTLLQSLKAFADEAFARRK